MGSSEAPPSKAKAGQGRGGGEMTGAFIPVTCVEKSGQPVRTISHGSALTSLGDAEMTSIQAIRTYYVSAAAHLK